MYEWKSEMTLTVFVNEISGQNMNSAGGSFHPRPPAECQGVHFTCSPQLFSSFFPSFSHVQNWRQFALKLVGFFPGGGICRRSEKRINGDSEWNVSDINIKKFFVQANNLSEMTEKSKTKAKKIFSWDGKPN